MKSCVVGAGAIGGWIAAELAMDGGDVSVVARGETLQAIDSEGLRLTQHNETRCVAVSTASNPSALGTQDVVVIAVKAPALAELAPALDPLIGPDTLIVPMQNGVPWWFLPDEQLRSVDPVGDIAEALPFEQVIGCVVHANCRRVKPNEVEVVHSEKLILGEPSGGISDRVKRLSTLFENTVITTDESENIRQAIWYKLWGNATINPMQALTRATADQLLDEDTIRGFMAEAMDELAAVGSAIGCPIDKSAEDRMEVTGRLGAFKSSMLQDVEAGRSIELDALVGAPIEIARLYEIPTPALDRIYAMTRLMAENLGLA